MDGKLVHPIRRRRVQARQGGRAAFDDGRVSRPRRGGRPQLRRPRRRDRRQPFPARRHHVLHLYGVHHPDWYARAARPRQARHSLFPAFGIAQADCRHRARRRQEQFPRPDPGICSKHCRRRRGRSGRAVRARHALGGAAETCLPADAGQAARLRCTAHGRGAVLRPADPV